jgi:hypothetical protein
MIKRNKNLSRDKGEKSIKLKQIRNRIENTSTTKRTTSSPVWHQDQEEEEFDHEIGNPFHAG